ncbi:MAG TPA: competence protein CoiA family protein, partial [Ktedonobacteraceae bacterium]
CRGLVHVRGGPEKRIQLHFAHQRGECLWSTESETVRHMRGKKVLAEWLRKQFPQASVSLEERLPEPNRIADIFVAHADGQRWAVEYQCAPLDIEEWRLRHTAYRKAGIQETWIVGKNRQEKQEGFIEAIIAFAREVMFLDPLVTPPRVWLRWPVTRETVQEWQTETGWTPSLAGWIGRSRPGYGATLSGQLQDVRLGEDGKLIHPDRSALEGRIGLLRTMKDAQSIDAATLHAYLCPIVGEEVLRVVLFPMIRSYMRDPALLRRYNYGRGFGEQSASDADMRRVQQARAWLEKLSLQGYPPSSLETLAKKIPLVGPYAAFANFVEMLAFLS